MTRVSTLSLTEALNSLTLPELNRNLFSSPAWLSVIQKTYGTPLFVKYIKRGGQVDSYIVYSVVRNFLEWKICLLSYSDYCDGYIKKPDDWTAFFNSLRKDYPRFRIALRNLRDQFARESACFKPLSEEWHHVLDVQASLDEVWKNTHSSFRSPVKQAQKAGVVVKICAKTELKEFYKLHVDLRKNKYKLFAQPYRFLEKIWDEFMAKDNGVLIGAYDPEGSFIGGNIYLICGDTLYYKLNTSAQAALKLRPNNILFWEGIKFAKERGLKFIDLGSSGLDQHGLVQYKDHTGATRMKIHHIGFHPPRYKFSEKRFLRLMTKVFTSPWVPDCVLHWGSSIIYRYLA